MGIEVGFNGDSDPVPPAHRVHPTYAIEHNTKIATHKFPVSRSDTGGTYI